jgi:hypothetical protein
MVLRSLENLWEKAVAAFTFPSIHHHCHIAGRGPRTQRECVCCHKAKSEGV